MTTKSILVITALLLVSCGLAVTAQAITVSGQAVSDCLGPVSGMWVSFGADGYAYRSVQTDADGRYSFTDVLASEVEAWVSFRAPTGMQIVSPIPSTVYISLQSDQTIDVDLASNIATIHGQLTSDCDGGLANVPVFLDLRDGSDPWSTTSDADGYYSFTDVFSTNSMRLWIEAPAGYLVAYPYYGAHYIWPGSSNIQRDFQLLCPPTVIYFEDFSTDDHDWTALDNTYQTDNAGPRESYWQLYSYNDAGNSRGVYWCGLDASDPCAGLTMPGYGTNWDERLVKSLTLPAASTMTIVHQFDTERNYDYCYLQISVDGGTTYATLATYEGNSWGFITSNIALVGYEGDVDFRFRFTSDGGGDDEDSDYDSDGAWRIDSIALNGVVIADFESGDDDWLPQPLGGPALAGFRLESDPPCDPAGTCYANMGRSWVAYDPVTGLVPLSSEDHTIRLALESPEIYLPSDYQTVTIDFCKYMNGMALNEVRYISFEIISAHPSTGCWRWRRTAHRW